jgi:hypothetical protein
MLGDNGFAGAQRREVVAKVGVAQLHHSFQSREMPQLMRSKVGQPGVGWQPVENQIFGDARQHGLPAVG